MTSGQEYPIHPLDLTTMEIDFEDNIQRDSTFCLSALNPTSPNEEYDMILGDSFMRNVYTS